MAQLSKISLLALIAAAALASPAQGARVWAVGDGASTATNTDEAVAGMIASDNPDLFLYLGDVYDSGTAAEYELGYAPGFGQLKAITRPTPGNHEWGNRAVGYDPYWGSAYTAPHYYSFDLGNWHFISLNSEEDHGEGSAQLAWLGADLAAHPGTCSIAYFHRPRYSASVHGDEQSLSGVWSALSGHAVLVLAGHEHAYERLVPIDGITEIVAGTGGRSLYAVEMSDARLAYARDDSYGALALDLSEQQVDFRFVSVAGATLDQGSVACQRPAAATPAEPDSSAPRITALRLKRRRLHGRHRRRAHPVVSLGLSESATVDIVIRRLRGHSRSSRVARFKLKGQAGSNRFRLGKRLHRPLRLGRYRLKLRATDDAGNRSRWRSLRLRVLRRA